VLDDLDCFSEHVGLSDMVQVWDRDDLDVADMGPSASDRAGDLDALAGRRQQPDYLGGDCFGVGERNT
jgi:hypothetical protein